MPILAILGIIQGLISGAGPAVDLWNKINTALASGNDISDEHMAEIQALAPAAHAAVAATNGAMTIIATHVPTADDLNNAELARIEGTA